MPYELRITTAMQSLRLPPGAIATVRVHHDAGCPILAGKPACRCSPDIFIDTPQGRIEVTTDGRVRQPDEHN